MGFQFTVYVVRSQRAHAAAVDAPRPTADPPDGVSARSTGSFLKWTGTRRPTLDGCVPCWAGCSTASRWASAYRRNRCGTPGTRASYSA